MEIVEAIQNLEMTYRIAIFCLLVSLGMFATRDYINELLTRWGGAVEFYLDSFLGTVLFASWIGTAIGVIRFGVQIVFGV
ncbi:hypothetical protein ST201phi2-1p265 [Pseudomonas phage 201phi2-1]|uniref:Uncharacterized protein n=1 Tax=Pseudomonas phage 201phi2-1 TaxID=198110 RepID=B3FJC7_BP201|nr:hypothetical protein ST201phi2-1p265 [Pseudomonas phage 201phi2-1]ABY63093.1 hypothetical protein 201phi2-1p265 [Pseudomonas phage 201phi2-1]